MVNRIAAGEIIIAPANALKEMLENSVDAASTSIEILVKDGGLKLLQITDNGSGINKEDLPILCKRFTTSKLTEFEDLNKLTTYGFRGEALASISHIAHLTVTTKQKDSPCAWKVGYLDGKEVGEPKAVAGRDGTIIQVEDLFYNVPARKRVFKSKAEEFSKVLDVIGRYAIHCTHVSFSCKKFGDAHPSLIVSASRPSSSKSKTKPPETDRIRQVYGSAIANELITVEIPAKPEYGFLGGKGQITSANYNAKKAIPPVLFINHRSVACDPLRRALLQGVYSKHLPKGGHAFVYLALDFDPRNLDVNIHPTKRDVRFLFEDEVIDMICTSVQQVLAAQGSSRTFKTQTILTIPGVSVNTNATGGINMSERSRTTLGGAGEGFKRISNMLVMQPDDNDSIEYGNNRPQSRLTDKKKVYEYNLVRTNHAQTQLPAMFQNAAFSQGSIVKSHRVQKRAREEDEGNAADDELSLRKAVVEIDDDELMPISAKVINSSESPSSSNGPLSGNATNSKNNGANSSSSTVSNDTNNQIMSSNSQNRRLAKEKAIKQCGITIPGNILYVSRDRVDVRLSSVRLLKKEVETEAHDALTEVLSKMTFVGVVDHKRRLMAFQHDIRLYMIDYGKLSEALFYQTALGEFSNLGTITLQGEKSKEVQNNGEYGDEEEPELGLKLKDIMGPNASTELNTDNIVMLWEMRSMLREYFSIRFATPTEVSRIKKIRARMIDRLSHEQNIEGQNEDKEAMDVDKDMGMESEEEISDIDEVIERPVLEKNSSEVNEEAEEVDNEALEKFQRLEQEYITKVVSTFWGSRLVTLPMILKGYIPPLAKLSIFVSRLVNQVSYENENECFRLVLTHLAQFYSPEPVLDDNDGIDFVKSNRDFSNDVGMDIYGKESSETRKAEGQEDVEENSFNSIGEDTDLINDTQLHSLTPVQKSKIAYRQNRRKEISELLTNVICPAAKMRVLAPKTLLKDVVEIANLPGLYKVFERC